MKKKERSKKGRKETDENTEERERKERVEEKKWWKNREWRRKGGKREIKNSGVKKVKGDLKR